MWWESINSPKKGHFPFQKELIRQRGSHKPEHTGTKT